MFDEFFNDDGEEIDPKVEELFEKFWKPILFKDGKLNMDQLKKELCDYYFIIDQVPKVYDYVTGGKVSKPNTYADAVIGEYENYIQEIVNDTLKEEFEVLLDEYQDAIDDDVIDELKEKYKIKT